MSDTIATNSTTASSSLKQTDYMQMQTQSINEQNSCITALQTGTHYRLQITPTSFLVLWPWPLTFWTNRQLQC